MGMRVRATAICIWLLCVISTHTANTSPAKATGLALELQFACRHPEHNTHLVFKFAVNGTFYNTRRPHNLASLVFWDGKKLGEFPKHSTRKRGGLVCYKSGTVEAGYFEVRKEKLMWNGAPPKWDDIKWAITGGGLFLLNGKPIGALTVSKTEQLSSYITTHPRYSYILVHKDRKTITIGISRQIPPATLAKQLANRYYALLRLDGGSATCLISSAKLPNGVHNIVGFVRGEQRDAKQQHIAGAN